MNTNPIHLTSSDIAKMADVSLSTVSNWRARHQDFPEPVSGSGSSPRFDVIEVRQWLTARGRKIKDLSADRVLWNVMNQWRGGAPVEEIGKFVSALLVWRFVTDPASPGFVVELSSAGQWPNLTQQRGSSDVFFVLREGVQEFYDKTQGNYQPIFDDLFQFIDWGPQGDISQPMDSLVDIINSFDSHELGAVYMAFQDRLTQSMHRKFDEYASSNALIDLMVAVSEDIPGPVHDPAVGSGRLLFAVGNHGQDRTQLTGQDVAVSAYIQARQRAVITRQDHVRIELGDVFDTDYFEPGSAQVVVMDPPYAMRYPEIDRLALDYRFPYGTPSKTSLDTGWLQLALWYLGSQGRAFVLQPPGTAFRGGADGTIRANMLKSGTIEAIVSLPPGMANHTSIALDLWVLARPGESADPDKVLLIDDSETQGFDANAIAKILRDWRTQGIEPEDAHAGVFSLSDILEKDSILTPKRWIALEEDAVTLESVKSDMEALHTAVSAIETAELTDPVTLTAAQGPPKLISVAELVKAGSLEVLRARTRGRTSDSVESPQGVPVVDLAWIRDGRTDRSPVEPESIPGEPLFTKPGDVVLQNTGGLAARADHEGGRVLIGSTFQILRLQDDRLMPEYVAEMLVSAANRRQALGTGIPRIRLEDLHIALLPQDAQQRLVDQFTTIRRLQTTAQDVLEASAQARDALVDGVTGGVIQAK